LMVPKSSEFMVTVPRPKVVSGFVQTPLRVMSLVTTVSVLELSGT
jgi:hypothetical protein